MITLLTKEMITKEIEQDAHRLFLNSLKTKIPLHT